MALALRTPDTLDKTTLFIAKRDGLDKVLKLLQYTSKLMLSVSGNGSLANETLLRLGDFAASVGQSRWAATPMEYSPPGILQEEAAAD